MYNWKKSDIDVAYKTEMFEGKTPMSYCETLMSHREQQCWIGRLRKYLDQSTTEKLVHAFITSKLDSCNSLLAGLPDSELSKLQSVQNTAARLVNRSKECEHITPVLQRLHWLPVKARIDF